MLGPIVALVLLVLVLGAGRLFTWINAREFARARAAELAALAAEMRAAVERANEQWAGLVTAIKQMGASFAELSAGMERLTAVLRKVGERP